MRTGLASIFCEAWSPLLEPRQIRASGRSQISQIRTKIKMRQYPSGRELLFEQTTPMKHWPVNIHISTTTSARTNILHLYQRDVLVGFRAKIQFLDSRSSQWL